MPQELYEFSFRGTVASEGSTIFNSQHYLCVADNDTPWTRLVRTSIGAAIAAHLKPKYLNCLSNDYYLVSWVLAGQTVNPFDPIEVAYPDTPPGQRPGPMLTPAVAAILSKKTGLFGRKNRGRNFISPLSETDVDGSILTPAYKAVLQEFGDRLVEYPAGGPGGMVIIPVIYSRTFDQGNPVVECIARPAVGTMRSRLFGKGI